MQIDLTEHEIWGVAGLIARRIYEVEKLRDRGQSVHDPFEDELKTALKKLRALEKMKTPPGPCVPGEVSRS